MVIIVLLDGRLRASLSLMIGDVGLRHASRERQQEMVEQVIVSVTDKSECGQETDGGTGRKNLVRRVWG